VYRRICFLRLEGLAGEAQLVQDAEFAEAAARARDLFSSESEADALLKELMGEEEERVSQAVAMAEVLVPMLARRLSIQATAPAPRPPAPAPRTHAPERTAGTRGVADFIDEMLEQERLAAR
jgi:hypothetical protein